MSNSRPSQPASASATPLVDALAAALPQTQCTRCGYPSCHDYAVAIAAGAAHINQCPPGGDEGIKRLATISGQAYQTLNPEHGLETPRTLAVIDEDWCIGCTLCIKACPTDAIVGGNKRMHTVIEPWCTGCELCIPVCPVDCIALVNASGTQTGWAAWSSTQAEQAKARYGSRQWRLQREAQEHQERQQQHAAEKLAHLTEHSKITDAATLERKRSIIEAALARAKARQQPQT